MISWVCESLTVLVEFFLSINFTIVLIRKEYTKCIQGKSPNREAQGKKQKDIPAQKRNQKERKIQLAKERSNLG